MLKQFIADQSLRNFVFFIQLSLLSTVFANPTAVTAANFRCRGENMKYK